jgi:hypothetical protein
MCVSELHERLKAGIVEPEKTVVARQRLGKHVLAATNGRGDFHAVRIISDAQYEVKGK